MSLPDSISDSNLNDLNSIETDVSVLIEKYLNPIERLRSRSRPNPNGGTGKDSTNLDVIKNDFKNLQISATAPLESRTSAFYRMLGLPVIGGQASFYNPGFDPTRAAHAKKQQEINTQFYSKFKDLANQIQVREKRSQNYLNIFGKQNLTASLYALLLRYPAPFAIFKPEIKSLEIDNQTVTVQDREEELKKIAKDNPSFQETIFSFGAPFQNVTKLLKPFIVDPQIENTIIPDTNKICVPFLLNKQATKIHNNDYCLRPGIELILRQRLAPENLQVNSVFLKDIENLISQTSSSTTSETSSAERSDILDTLSALSNSNEISNSTKDIFSHFSTLQSTIVLGLIKTIKYLINKLNKNIILIDEVKTQINWIPVPSTGGPGTGPLGASATNSGLKNSSSTLDVSITELRIKKLNSETQTQLLEDLGEFASPFKVNANSESSKNYSEELDQQVSKRDRLAHSALVAMGEIENITGEVAGLGLVDVLAIYIALWSMDLNNLLSLIDDNSFDRLYQLNKNFRGVTEVENRFNLGSAGVSISEALDNFQHKLGNILTWADSSLTSSLIISSSESGFSALESGLSGAF